VGPKARLPVVKVDSVPTAGRLEDASARRLVSVLAGAPRPLRPQLERAYDSPRGVTIVVRDGPVLYFGAPSRITAKWAAASRVLADSGSRGARFIDVRLPERPAASGFGAGDTGPPV
jgi:cell division protein FtsQ